MFRVVWVILFGYFGLQGVGQVEIFLNGIVVGISIKCYKEMLDGVGKGDFFVIFEEYYV